MEYLFETIVILFQVDRKGMKIDVAWFGLRRTLLSGSTKLFGEVGMLGLSLGASYKNNH